MRLPERYKQTIYVSNETYFGSEEYDKPYVLKGIVTPKSDSALYGGGVVTQQNNVELKFESKLEGVKQITQNTRIWIKREPDENQDYSNYTHVVVSRDTTTHQWFATIECRSATENFPFL